MSPLLDFPGVPQCSHCSQNVLITYHMAMFLSIVSRMILFLTIQYNCNLWKNNLKQCIQMPSKLFFLHCTYYIVFVSSFFFPLSYYFMEYILDMKSISLSGSSAKVLVISTENNLLKYFLNIRLLVFYWVPLTKKKNKIRKKWKQSIRKMEQMQLKEKDLCLGTFVSDYWGFSYVPRQSTCPKKADKAVGFWISSFRLQFLLAGAMSYVTLVMY